jgi:alpha-1,3-mannosyltransferase
VRVAHVVRQFYPGVGGLESFVLALAKQQRLEGVDAEIVTLDRLFTNLGTKLPRYDCVEDIPVRRIGFSGSTRYPIAPGVFSCIKPFDIVHVHGIDFFCDYLAATQLLHRKPLVLSTHGGFFHTNFARSLKTAVFHTVTRASLLLYGRVVACSANDEVIFRKVAGRRFLRIDNGVDTTKFADLASRSIAPNFVYFGRFSSNKGLARLIDAFDAMCDEIPEARLHLMGRDWDNLLPALNQRIAAVRQSGAILVHVNPSDDDIRRVIAKSSFFASAPDYEGFGLTLVEALAAGLLPIVSTIPSFVSILGDSDTGRTIQFADTKNAGREMAAFVREAAKGYRARRTRAMRLASRYAWPKVARRFVREYEHVLGRREREIFGGRFRLDHS